jgi:glycosyltransferase involved in cell wall biosynthesis
VRNNQPIVSIVIPAYNEEDRVGKVLSDLANHRATSKTLVEVIVVDDGSVDKTAAVIQVHPHDKLLVHEQNRGRASAIQSGLAAASGAFIAVFDADFEYYPSDLFVAIETISGRQDVVVYGSRYKQKSNFSSARGRLIGRMNDQGAGPWLANWLIATYVGLLYGRFYTEHLSGIRVYPASFIKAFSWKSTGFEGDHEIAAAAILQHLQIIEVPCSYTARSKEEGKKIRASDGFRAIKVFTIWRLIGRRLLKEYAILN